MSFDSEIKKFGEAKLPAYAGIRVMMMPYRVDDPDGTLPPCLSPWFDTLLYMGLLADPGVGYLTIDECMVRAGETQRRPGLHVDGIGPNGRPGPWGGGGGGWGARGMTMVSSHVGCVGYNQIFSGQPGTNGDCSHLESQLSDADEIVLQPSTVYWCGPLAVHRAIPMEVDTYRQFCRVSFPSDAPWYEGYTPNPRGIQPAGPIHPARTEYMNYRP